MAATEVRAQDFVQKAIESSMVEIKHPVVFKPDILASPILRDLGSSSNKRVFEFAKLFIPISFGEGSSGEGSGEGSNKKPKK